MSEQLSAGEAWASRTLLKLQSQVGGVLPSDERVVIDWPDAPGVVALLEQYFRLAEADRKLRQQLRENGALGGAVTSPAKAEASRRNGQRAGEAHRRRAMLRRAEKEAAELQREIRRARRTKRQPNEGAV